jgi:GNAT superfamily N-acetyltransferase
MPLLRSAAKNTLFMCALGLGTLFAGRELTQQEIAHLVNCNMCELDVVPYELEDDEMRVLHAHQLEMCKSSWKKEYVVKCATPCKKEVEDQFSSEGHEVDTALWRGSERLAWAASIFSYGKKDCYLAAIEVVKKYRGQGLGNVLFHYTMDQLKERGAKKVAFEADPTYAYRNNDEWYELSLLERLQAGIRLHRFYRHLGAVDAEGNNCFVYET